MSAVRKPQPAAPFQPLDLRCFVCGGVACFGQRWPLVADERWFCPTCKPDDFYGDRR